MADTNTLNPWFARGALAHERLLGLLARATDKQFSGFFLEVMLLLTRAGLNPKSSDAPDTRGWLRVQLDFLWLDFGSQKPREWAWEATQLFARVSGPALMEFRRLAAATDYKKDPGADLAALLLAEHEGTIQRGNGGRLIPVPDTPPEPKRVTKNTTPPFHRSQRQAFERCVALGKLHFSGILANNTLQPRTNVLLVGSSGSGKSFIAREVAKALNAHFISLTFGRWIPFGVRDNCPTPYTILRAARDHERVVVFLDEIDKAFSVRSGGEWSKSVISEVLSALEKQFPLEEFAAYEKSAGKRSGEGSGTAKKNEAIDVNRIWYVAAGAWQDLTGSSPHPRKIGFGGGEKNEASNDETVLSKVRASDAIPLELLARFHAEPLLLRYPSPDEIPSLISAYGLDELAAQAGVDLSDVKLDFNKGGMRVFEALAADLGLKILAQKEAQEAQNER